MPDPVIRFSFEVRSSANWNPTLILFGPTYTHGALLWATKTKTSSRQATNCLFFSLQTLGKTKAHSRFSFEPSQRRPTLISSLTSSNCLGALTDRAPRSDLLDERLCRPTSTSKPPPQDSTYCSFVGKRLERKKLVCKRGDPRVQQEAVIFKTVCAFADSRAGHRGGVVLNIASVIK